MMADKDANPLVLESFLPYRLSFLTNIISQDLARLYGEKFDLTPHEWKVLANLKRHKDMSAAEVAEKTALDKVAVSRAVRTLGDKGLVNKIFSPEDRRRSVLNLTEKGTAIYHQIEPLVVGYERDLLASLDLTELTQLDQLLTKLTARATGPEK